MQAPQKLLKAPSHGVYGEDIGFIICVFCQGEIKGRGSWTEKLGLRCQWERSAVSRMDTEMILAAP